ncbi:Ig-like domain-containing protein [Cohnella thailandensis]|uniref:S-layer homology domain-containing protein n=1 Tax=Cohnella thailandensis TaxID=557557 RepID=A0A841SU58_9BACL|nr:Ig-like domain-containing protein [Cohnella thailandensis]MBB6633430.1 S-layer homology domain-containing protein [Cohnella thailandensis]MBP1974444.1 hypothetical protein [Cohnella thailandensis]
MTVPPFHSIYSNASFDLWSEDSDATFECSLDGAVFAACANNNAYAGLTDGWHTLLARAVSSSGESDSSPASYSWLIETGPPAAPNLIAPANGSATTPLPAIRGTASNAKVTVFVDDVELGTIDVNNDGSWTFPLTVPLSDGSHTVSTRAVDAAGNAGAYSATHTFTVDSIPPGAPTIINPANGGITNNSTPIFRGSAEPNVSVTVLLDGAAAATVNANASGNWSWTPSAPLADGAHVAKAKATDSAGNESSDSGANTFTVDTAAPPAPVLTSPAHGSTLADFTPTISGTAEANATVTVIIDSVPVGTTVANVSGNWTLGLPSSLSEGLHTAMGRATDAAGNTSPNSALHSFTVDSTPPAAPVVITPANGTSTNDPTPVFSGTAVPNVSITVLLDGAAAATVNADASGNWSWTPSAPLADGAHVAKAKATDSAGNASPDSGSHTFTVDATAPAAPAIAGPADGSILAVVTPSVSGTAEAYSTVTVIIDGASAGTTVVNGSGHWTWTASVPLAEGTHTVKAIATDAQGNTGSISAENAFVVDTTAPSAPAIVSPSDGSVVTDSTPTIGGTAEANATVSVLLDGSSAGTVMTNASGVWSWTPSTTLAEGDHSVKATATDAVGNESVDSTAVTFTVDTTAPSSPTITSPEDGSATSNAKPMIGGTAEVNATVTVLLDGSSAATVTADASGVWSWTPGTALTDGAHSIKATATDAVGNESVESTAVTFTVDTTAPGAPAATSPEDGSATSNARPMIGGTAEANATVTVLLDGASAATVTADASGVWSWTPSTALTDGAHSIKAIATDTVGNESVESTAVTFAVDTTAPGTPTVTSPEDGSATSYARPTIGGTAEADATVTVLLDGSSAATVTADASGVWSWMPSTALTDGAHSVKATATDAVGNESVESTAVTFTVDTTAPGAPTVTSPEDGSATSNAKPTIGGTAEANATVAVLLDGSSAATVTADASGVWSWTPGTALAEGDHSVKVTATDAVGNESAESAAVAFSVRTAVVAPPSSSPATLLVELKLTSDDEALALTPAFKPDVFFYRAQTNREEVRLQATANLSGMKLSLNGAAWDGDDILKLKEGDNELQIVVTAANGMQASYSLALHREAAEPVVPCPFVDVAGHWAGTNVCEAYELGIVNGIDDSHFQPNRYVTRAEFAVMLMNAIKPSGAASDTGAAAFADEQTIPEWAVPAVKWAKDAGVAAGFPDGSFRPQQEISRAEMAVMLIHAASWPTETEETGALGFKDDADIPNWARSSVRVAVSRGVLEGSDEGRFQPEALLTRAEAATALLRLFAERSGG